MFPLWNARAATSVDRNAQSMQLHDFRAAAASIVGKEKTRED
jgi:hypothetical protein